MLIFSNNFLLEVTRKLKSREEVSHHDDYISLLGKKNNILLISGLISSIFLLNFLLITIIPHQTIVGFCIYSLFTIGLFFCIFSYSKNPTRRNKKIAILLSLFYYLFSNTLFLFA